MGEHPAQFVDGMPARDDQFNTATAFHLRVKFQGGIELDLRHTASEDLDFGDGIMFS